MSHTIRATTYIIGLIAAACVFALMLTDVTRDGIAVPTQLDELVAASSAEEYQVPANVDATCVSESDVTDAMRADINTAVGTLTACQFNEDSLEADAAWGAAAALAILVALFLLRQFFGVQIQVTAVTALVVLVGYGLLNAWLDDAFKDWLDDRDIVYAVFLRGFLSVLALCVGYVLTGWLPQRVEATRLSMATATTPGGAPAAPAPPAHAATTVGP